VTIEKECIIVGEWRRQMFRCLEVTLLIFTTSVLLLLACLTSTVACRQMGGTSTLPSSSLSRLPALSRRQHCSPQYYSHSPSPTAHSYATPRIRLLSSSSLVLSHPSSPVARALFLPAQPQAPRSASGTPALSSRNPYPTTTQKRRPQTVDHGNDSRFS
jgi:hypothetical protein